MKTKSFFVQLKRNKITVLFKDLSMLLVMLESKMVKKHKDAMSKTLVKV